MQNPNSVQISISEEHIEKWPVSKVIFVIGCILLIAAASYTAYLAIDAQALRESLLQ